MHVMSDSCFGKCSLDSVIDRCICAPREAINNDFSVETDKPRSQTVGRIVDKQISQVTTRNDLQRDFNYLSKDHPLYFILRCTVQ